MTKESELQDRIVYLECAVLALADKLGYHGAEVRPIEHSQMIQRHGVVALGQVHDRAFPGSAA
jgi:hypothetical protein